MKQSIKIAARTVSAWIVGAALAAGASTVGAAVLYQQTPALDNAYGANVTSPQEIADNFTLGGKSNLQSITWWGIYTAETEADNFTVRFYSSGAVPGAEISSLSFSAGAATRTATGDVLLNTYDVYRYDFSLAPSEDIDAGAYFISIQNVGANEWYWLTGAPGDGAFAFRSGSPDWFPEVGDLAFRLNGDVLQQIPEPGSLALLLLAGSALLLTRRQVIRRR